MTIVARSEVLRLWVSPESGKLEEKQFVYVARHGVVGDYHYGKMRDSDSREAHLYERGTRIPNFRQITAIYEGDQQRIAENWMSLAKLPSLPIVEPEDMLPNLLLVDFDTDLDFPSAAVTHDMRLRFINAAVKANDGVVLRSMGKNEPCGIPGNNIRNRNPEMRDLLKPQFFNDQKVASGLRGSLLVVERVGVGMIKVGDRVELIKIDD